MSTSTDVSPATQLRWHAPNVPPFSLSGFAWYAEERVYRRLPRQPRQPLPEAVDHLANNTAGGQIRFQTDSTRLAIRVRLPAPADMDHMPASGQCGFDCYLGAPGEQRYHSTTRYAHQGATEYEYQLFTASTRAMRHFTLNFPLYQGVEEVQIGLDESAQILPPFPYGDSGRVVVYGTSITQGGCASRPGMAYTNILSRRLNREFINLGFSGSGRGEPEVAEVIAEISDVACFVLDYEANVDTTENMQRTLPEFIRILRAAHAETPILVVSRIPFAYDLTNAEERNTRERNRDYQRATVETLQRNGDAAIFFHDGSLLLGERADECTVDGIHPSDLGFMRIADALELVLRAIVG